MGDKLCLSPAPLLRGGFSIWVWMTSLTPHSNQFSSLFLHSLSTAVPAGNPKRLFPRHKWPRNSPCMCEHTIKAEDYSTSIEIYHLNWIFSKHSSNGAVADLQTTEFSHPICGDLVKINIDCLYFLFFILVSAHGHRCHSFTWDKDSFPVQSVQSIGFLLRTIGTDLGCWSSLQPHCTQLKPIVWKADNRIGYRTVQFICTDNCKHFPSSNVQM